MVKKKIEAPTVKVGQVWRDRDERQPSRWLVVEKVSSATPYNGKIATCRVHKRVHTTKGEMIIDTGRTTRVRVDRFRPTSTGYKLVERIGE